MSSIQERAAAAAADKLRRRGLRFNPETQEVEPIPKDEPNDNTDQSSQEPNEPAQAAADQTPASPASTPSQDADLLARFEKLQSDHNALLGRLAPAQRDADTFRGLYETVSKDLSTTRETLSAQLNDLTSQLNEATSARQAKDIQAQIDELLDDEDRDTVDPSVLKVIKKIAASGAFSKPAAPAFDHRAEVARILAEKESQTVESYRNGLLNDSSTEVGKIRQLSEDQAFIAYCTEHPEVDVTIVNLFNAKTTADIDKYAKASNRLISAYRTGKAPAETRAPDPKGSSSSVLSQALARSAAPGLTEAQMRQKTQEFKMLIRTNTPESKKKAALLMAELDAQS